MKHMLGPVFFGVVCVFAFGLPLYGADIDPPNIVLILADDLGYGDLGCYGSGQNLTPNIDRLASEGIRFTDFHSNGAMCTPTRAALLTGLYQQRFGAQFEGPLSSKTNYHEGLPLGAVTIAERLKDVGYVTGMFGKWHLGYRPPYLPTRQGFDEFIGLTTGDGDHHSQIDRSGREDWWHQDQIHMEKGYTADLLTRHSIRFIEEHQDTPFFLYLPHLAIHFPWQGPDDPVHRVKGKDYWNDKWGVISDQTNVHPHVQAMIESLDQSVGEIISTLKRLELDERTLVIFCSDNGGYINYGDSHFNISSNGALRGQKSQMFEGGHRVPAIAWWPGRIQPRVSNQTVMTFDFFPTFLALAKGASSGKVEELDGVNLARFFLSNERLSDRDLFWRDDDVGAIRRGAWKLVIREGKDSKLFNLHQDLGEHHDLAGDLPERVQELESAYRTWAAQVFVQNTATTPLPTEGE
jgi:arylsulfatase A-like enzyme